MSFRVSLTQSCPRSRRLSTRLLPSIRSCLNPAMSWFRCKRKPARAAPPRPAGKATEAEISQRRPNPSSGSKPPALHGLNVAEDQCDAGLADRETSHIIVIAQFEKDVDSDPGCVTSFNRIGGIVLPKTSSSGPRMIERLYIQNYRTLESVTLDFAGHPSALLIGKNGAGKSTVLESVRLFQQICRGSSRVGKIIGANDFSQNRTDRPMRFEIEV